MIKFHCTSCYKKIGMEDQYATRLIKCPVCRQPNRVPPKTESDYQEPVYSAEVLEEADESTTTPPAPPQTAPTTKSDDIPVLEFAEDDPGPLPPPPPPVAAPIPPQPMQPTVPALTPGAPLAAGVAVPMAAAQPVAPTLTSQHASIAPHPHDGKPDGFFGRIGRSWEFAKISYGIIWDFKILLLFPILSGIATIIVMASFLVPLFTSGTLESWQLAIDETGQLPILSYVITFAFYFASYFVIVFFNTALIACAMKVISGEVPTLGYGISIAIKRLPQIIAWSLLSAVVGVVLKIIENAHEKFGEIIAAILGTAWTALTYFVVPVLCVEGTGPFKSIKQSVATMRQSWGEALVGNFSLGLLSSLVLIPVLLLVVGVGYLAGQSGSITMVVIFAVMGVTILLLAVALTSAADIVFKAILYNYATGRALPANIDANIFPAAFAQKAKK